MRNMLNSSKGAVRIIALVVIIAIVAGGAYFFYRHMNGRKAPLEFQKGIQYVTWSKEGYTTDSSDKSMKRMGETGTEWMGILVTWYQTNCWSNDIHRTAKTPSDEAVIHAINKARENNMKVMLKPHLDLLDKSDGSWRGDIGCVKESEWDGWFEQYTDFLMHYVEIAEEHDIELVCIGTELSGTATAKGYMWRDMIKKVRKGYSGHITYAAHWNRYQDIRFWEQLDYVGINAYFPLTEKVSPTLEELKKAWVEWKEKLARFHEKTGQPIIFPEIGCASAEGAAIRPWEHVPRSGIDLQLQKDYYQAIFETFWDQDWFYGMYWWYWGTNENMGGEYNRGFTPQNKPAVKVLKEWYSKPDPR